MNVAFGENLRTSSLSDGQVSTWNLSYPNKISLIMEIFSKDEMEETKSIHVRDAIGEIEQHQAEDAQGPQGEHAIC